MGILRSIMQWLLCVVLFGYFILFGWATNLNWDLNQHVGMVDSFLKNGSFYSGITHQFFPESAYFPGVSFLGYFFHYLGFYDIRFPLIVTASCFGMIMIALLVHCAFILFDVPKWLTTTFILGWYSLGAFEGFEGYIDYLKEFKPDTASLVFGILAFLLAKKASFFSEQKQSEKEMFWWFLCALSLCLSLLFKQQALAFFIAFFLSALFDSSLSLSVRKKLIIVSGLSFFMAVAILMQIPNSFFGTFFVMSKHPLSIYCGLKSLYVFFTKSKTMLYSIPLLFLVIKGVRAPHFFGEKSWIFLSCSWMFFSLLSAFKEGGNIGNIEVGALVFIPAVLGLIYKTVFDSQTEFYHKKHVQFFLFLFFGLLLSRVLFNTDSNEQHVYGLWKKIQYNTSKETVTLEFLKPYSGSKALIDADIYPIAKQANLLVISDVITAFHYHIAGIKPDYVDQALLRKEFDVVYVLKDYRRDAIINRTLLIEHYSQIQTPPGFIGYLWEKR